MLRQAQHDIAICLPKPIHTRMKPTTTITHVIEKERENFYLWIPVLLGFGVAFYFSFEANFLEKFYFFAVLFFSAALLYFLNRNSYRALIFAACALFLAGCFYANFYQKFFLNQTEIHGKIFVDVVGKVEDVRKFYNPTNHLEGANLLISDLVLYKSKFVEKKKIKKKKKVKKQKKKILKQVQDDVVAKPHHNRHPELVSGSLPKPKTKKPKKISDKKIEKDFLNLAEFQEIDREFLDYSKNYQLVAWQEINGREAFPNPPQKISVNLIKNFQEVGVNDVIAARLMLQPSQAKEFPDDFDFKFDAKSKRIGAYGFVLGEAKILEKAEISSLDGWFIFLREKIRGRILASLNGDKSAIALAFLIGDQSQISKNLLEKIRGSGLAHLLSISGFHLSLAGAIFFVATRFLLSRSEYLALHFDLKKISAFAAIFATYFYLKIAGSPLPAQRAFLMVLLVLIALFLNERIDSRRAIMSAVFFLILFNPYAVFNVSFQLSFAAILVLGIFYEMLSKKRNSNFDRRIFIRFFWYFLEIILVSILIQIATFPFLMHSFQNVALLGFVANVLAIPLTSFIVMPLGFLSLFLMPLGLEKYILFLMGEGIFWIEKIATFVTNFNYSNLISPQLSGAGLILAIIGLLLICLTKSELRFVGIAIFSFSFLTIFFTQKPDILFDGQQKFFAIYDKENGLVFSRNLRPSKQRVLWMKRMGEEKFKYLKTTENQKSVALSLEGKEFLILLKRNKISEICKKDFDVIVNLTAKYKLPDCINDDKIKIDNSDFYKKGGHFFYFKGDKILIKTTF
jgi:ComEC/Rec2-related protein